MDELTMKQRIKERYDQLSEKEKKVAKYIIDHYQQSMLLSSAELAQQSGVSNTAVVRFAKDMGYSGFIEYKKAWRKEYIPVQKVYASLPLMERGKEGDYLHNYFRSLLRDITGFIDSIDVTILTRMADQIMKSKRLYLVGFGSDEVVVSFLKNYLNLMGIQCIPVVEEGLALREKLFLMDSNDTVFMAAYPTLMESEVWVGKFAKSRGATLLVISDSEITAKQVGADIYAAFYESTDNFFNSYVLPMAFCNALLLHIFESYPKQITRSMERYERTLYE